MDEEKHYRHELKYKITCSEYMAVKERIRTVMESDPHARNGTYLIRSVYFDNIYDKALREKTEER